MLLTSDNCHFYHCRVIRQFRHRGFRRLYEDDDRREVNPQHADKMARMLARLDQATEPRHLDLPGWRLHPPERRPRRLLEHHRQRQLADRFPVRAGRRYGY